MGSIIGLVEMTDFRQQVTKKQTSMRMDIPETAPRSVRYVKSIFKVPVLRYCGGPVNYACVWEPQLAFAPLHLIDRSEVVVPLHYPHYYAHLGTVAQRVQ